MKRPTPSRKPKKNPIRIVTIDSDDLKFVVGGNLPREEARK
jgi:hypothetical protein